MRSKIVCALSLLFGVLLCAGRIAACSCSGGGGAPCEAYGRAGAVFVGTVTGVELRKIGSVVAERKREDAGEYLPPVTYSFAVQEAFGGVEGETVRVGTGSGGGDCGYKFVQGAQYIVYAYRDPRTGLLSTGICTNTRLAAAANEDLVFLRGLSGRASGVTVSGAVLPSHRTDDPATELLADKRVAGLPLFIDGEGLRREIRTDAEGRYRLAGLKAGTYTIKVTLPDELFAYRVEEKVTVAERGCGGANFYVADNGRISGQVIDADARPVPKMLLQLVRAEDVGAERPEWKYAEADGEGRFTFQPLAPGNYLLGVRLSGMSQPDAVANAYARTFYPGVSEAARATPITVSRAGEHVSGHLFQLPPRLTERTIEGFVALSGGRPAAKALITYQELSESGVASTYGAESDEQGRFKIKVSDGFTYLVGAYINTGTGSGQMHAEPVEVTASADTMPVKLIISEPGGSCERCRSLRSKKRQPRP